MIETILPILILWVTWSGGVYGLFYAIEQTANKKAKEGTAKWLKSMAEKSISQTIVESPIWFIEAFDSVFGKKHLTWRCFWRSCIASIAGVLVMTILLGILNPNSWKQLFIYGDTKEAVFVIFLGTSIFNFVPDYISLLETRWILSKATYKDINALIALLILDVVITGGIFLLCMGVIVWVIGLIRGDVIPVNEFLGAISDAIRFTDRTGPLTMGIFFYAAYFTSVWFYFFVASSIITKVAYSLGRFGNWMIALLDADRKPFQSMGLISVALSTGLLALYLVIKGIMSVG